MFPRYLFLHAITGSHNLAPVRSTQGVVSMVRFGTELAVVPDEVIEAIRRRIQPHTGLVKLEPAKISQGDRVKVFDGPLAGLEGIVQNPSGEKRTIILMELLGRLTKVQVNPMDLQKTA